ncbi:MAG: ABC transporter ATP-binding protein [Armatimonadota bacterium]|nr:ABC transporter ATP-binding protein [Armatimonadota bacterium]
MDLRADGTTAGRARAPSFRQVGSGSPAVELVEVTRRFGAVVALDRVSMRVVPGQVAALLGPNGAGKTTLLRVLTGLIDPHEGEARILGQAVTDGGWVTRRLIGLVPSGDRTFYLRLSGLENLVFFARLHGMRGRQAAGRAREVLDQVGLADAGEVAVGRYSHGMQKRLSVARALLTDPPVLLVDEATHDLDPEGAQAVRTLVRARAARGTAVIWTTQRVEEIRGFADTVTVLGRGRVLFDGTVPELLSRSLPRRYILQVRDGARRVPDLAEALDRALGTTGTIEPTAQAEHFLLALPEGAILGDAVAALTASNFQVLACREETPEVEHVFLQITRGDSR